jgi:hypothetical protein
MVSSQRALGVVLRSLITVVLASACSTGELTPTEVILLVDSDLGVPDELDYLDIRVAGPRGPEQDASTHLSAEHGLPRRLVLRDASGQGGSLHIVVLGRHGSADVVSRVADAAFEEGRQVTLTIDLLRSCVGVQCGAQTCTASGCADTDLAHGEVPDLGATTAPQTQPASSAAVDAGALDASNPSSSDAGQTGLDAGARGAAPVPTARDAGAPGLSTPASSAGPTMDASTSPAIPSGDAGAAITVSPPDAGMVDAATPRDAGVGQVPATTGQAACEPSLLCLISCATATRATQIPACVCLLECATQ